MKRRNFMRQSAVASAALMGPVSLVKGAGTADTAAPYKGRINHSACYWCYASIPLDTFLGNLVELGIPAIDLVGPEEFPLLKKHGIHASMCWGAGKGITDGWNDKKLHDELVKTIRKRSP